MLKISKISVMSVCLLSLGAGAQAATLDSTAFQYRYEGDHLPTGATGVTPEGNMVFDSFARTGVPTPSLGTYDGSTGYVGGSGGGILNLTIAASGSTFSFDEAVTVNKAVGYTVEFRVKALESNDSSGGSPREGLIIALGASDGTGSTLQIGTDRIVTSFSGSGLVTAKDNKSDFVTYRMVAEGGSSTWSLYRDGALLFSSINFSSWTANTLSFGDMSGAGIGHHQLDYLRIDTTGGYLPVPVSIPEPASLGVLLAGAALMSSRRLARA